ncbi:MAG: four helix bundle suffix domain-containing protein [Lentisphaeria bacterium]|nr:four helix bundle suffix domain-containing protein [Lentisphaeria bacterium]
MKTDENGELFLPSGGYRKLKSFQLARLIYDITVYFAELYIPADSRTRDQMVQAARSGVQNIAEGSVDAATSAKLEMNLYNVARASLEELRLDYQDYLRQHNCPVWTGDSALYREFVKLRISDKESFRAFIRKAESAAPSVFIRNIPYKSVLVANATLLLISAATFFLRRQIDSKAKAFLNNGGFSERMHQMRIKDKRQGRERPKTKC